MKLSICTDSIFSEIETVEAMSEVHKLGIQEIEFWSWWDKDIPGINQARKDLGLSITAICTKFISLTEPSERQNYLTALAETINIAQQLECPIIISQVGNRTKKTLRAQQESIVSGLRLAKELLVETGITLVIEPLNTKIDHSDYFLWSSNQASEIISQVNSPQIKILYDFYHQQIMEGDLIRQSTRLIEQIGHVHLAGHPGRHELEMGEINYEAIIQNLLNINYTGTLGLEYFPDKKTNQTLLRWQKFVDTKVKEQIINLEAVKARTTK